MVKNILKHHLILFLLGGLFSLKTFAQTEKLKFSQDPKFEQLLAEKRKINSTIGINEGYKIQIYNGDSETSRKELTKFKSDFNHLDVTIIFSTPYYKVWVGNFKSKIEAQRHWVEIQKKYSGSILIKPSK